MQHQGLTLLFMADLELHNLEKPFYILSFNKNNFYFGNWVVFNKLEDENIIGKHS